MILAICQCHILSYIPSIWVSHSLLLSSSFPLQQSHVLLVPFETHHWMVRQNSRFLFQFLFFYFLQFLLIGNAYYGAKGIGNILISMFFTELFFKTSNQTKLFRSSGLGKMRCSTVLLALQQGHLVLDAFSILFLFSCATCLDHVWTLIQQGHLLLVASETHLFLRGFHLHMLQKRPIKIKTNKKGQ